MSLAKLCLDRGGFDLNYEVSSDVLNSQVLVIPYGCDDTREWIEYKTGIIHSYIDSCRIKKWSQDWPRWWGPEEEADWVSPNSKIFQHIFKTKSQKNYRNYGNRLLLAITCNRFGDPRTTLIDDYEDESFNEIVQRAFEKGTQQIDSQFDEVWLVAEGSNSKLRVY